MAGESQLPPTSAPDPTDQTTAQLDKGLAAERDYVNGQVQVLEQRLAQMDVATRLLNETLTRVPTDLQTAVTNIKEVFDIRLRSEREIGELREQYRLELKADSEKALTAALAAAEKRAEDARLADSKARDAQIIAYQLATDKTEKTFKDALAQQQEIFTGAISNLVDGLSEVKSSISDMRSEKRGGQANMAGIITAVGFVATLLGLLIVLAGSGVFNK
jgi:hypothetical protein